ncbi:MAG: hypothetical protein WBY94_13020 [Polyangiaceae bacterium]
MSPPGRSVLLRVACVLALGALALMVWSLFDPRPVPVIAAMSIGQGFGTLSFASFLYVVVADLRRRGVSTGEGDAPNERRQ